MFFHVFTHIKSTIQITLCSDHLLGYNGLLYVNHLLSYNCLLCANRLLGYYCLLYANHLLGCNHLLNVNSLLGNNLVKSGARLFLFLQLCDTAPLFLTLCVATCISASPLCVGYILLLTSVRKDMLQRSELQAQKWVSNK